MIILITPHLFQRRKKCSQTTRATLGKVQREQLENRSFCESIFPALFEPGFISSITTGNNGYCPGLRNDSARGFCNAVVSDAFAIDRTI